MAWSADLFIKSLKAPILAAPQNGAQVLITVERGSKVDGLGEQGSFAQVKFKSTKGFVNKLFLSERPVEQKDTLLNQKIDISTKARKRASAFTSAAAARGLKEDSDEIFRSLGDANLEAIKKMEALVIREEQGLSFLLNKTENLNPKREEEP